MNLVFVARICFILELLQDLDGGGRTLLIPSEALLEGSVATHRA